MLWLQLPEAGGVLDRADDRSLSLGARLGLALPITVCSADEVLTMADAQRVLHHARHVWVLPGPPEIVGAYESSSGEPPPPVVAAAAEAVVRDGTADVVILPNHAYVYNAKARQTLLVHGLPVEQRLEALLGTLHHLRLLRVQDRCRRPRPAAGDNIKQVLPDASIGTAVLMVLLLLLGLFVAVLLGVPRTAPSASS